ASAVHRRAGRGTRNPGPGWTRHLEFSFDRTRVRETRDADAAVRRGHRGTVAVVQARRAKRSGRRVLSARLPDFRRCAAHSGLLLETLRQVDFLEARYEISAACHSALDRPARV